MIKIKEAVIVEGKYDKIKLASILDAPIVTTDGFRIFKDKEKQNFIRSLAEKRGILILTDSDSAGLMIRSFLGGSIKKEYIKHVYIPELFGKEKRKNEASKEGLLGVEGVSKEIILKSLERAGVFAQDSPEAEDPITKIDLYDDGFFGKDNCTEKRKILLKKVSLPSNLSTNALVQMLNVFMTKDEYKLLVKEIEESL
ncbi:MAG: DUF4093 domain-containing protein [Ruminococcaceae bacterium]|nr:DUF4093 domain-containing protein [Oscillospiraceae bacterium]